MHRVVLTGGPGAGKTTLLAELARRGFSIVSESARAVIAERLARGVSPRPDPETFAREILRRDREKYFSLSPQTRWVFFDRSPLEALAMLNEVTPLPTHGLDAAISEYTFHPAVFILPPWQAIYRTDAERDHPFTHAEQAHDSLVRWYERCGYKVHEVPRVSVEKRAEHVLQILRSSIP
jgi:predicted ATPase